MRSETNASILDILSHLQAVQQSTDEKKLVKLGKPVMVQWEIVAEVYILLSAVLLATELTGFNCHQSELRHKTKQSLVNGVYSSTLYNIIS